MSLLLLALLAAPATPPPCAPDNAGWKLPPGFCALLVADSLPGVRHIAVGANGDLFAARQGKQGGLFLLRDTTGDGRADVVRRIATGASTGVAWTPEAVYWAPNDMILRFAWRPGALEPSAPPDTIARDLPTGGHTAKTIAVGADGSVYVDFGSRTNSCQVADRKPRSPGQQPCVELETRAGIWRFDGRRLNQRPADGVRFATGLRNAMAMAIEPATKTLYAAVHGRDQLADNWGFTAEQNAENPAEEFGPITAQTNFGWPYCYYDPRAGKKVVAPEYGGDGVATGDCGQYQQPAIAFPAHWAPLATSFYAGTQFPAAYRGGAFIAFHGSWNRAPLPQQGYRVVFVPFRAGKPVGTYEPFAAPADVETAIRPSGVTLGPDGSLYIGADTNGKIWRILYLGR